MNDEPTVTGLEASVYVIPTDAPEADGTLAWDKTTMVLVTARAADEQGIGWTYTDPAAAAVVTGVLAGTVLGTSAFDIPRTQESMSRALRNTGRPGIGSMAISAVDMALWDLKARLLGCSLSGLLGRARDEVPVYGSGGFTSYDDEQLHTQLHGWVHDLGIPRVKIKIGESWGTNVRRDLSRVEQARKIIGPDTELYVDANGGYTVAQAIRVASDMLDYDVAWYEEPVSSRDPGGLAAVRRQVHPDVAAGEYSWTLADSARLIGSVDCLQLDATRCGGYTDFLRASALAAAHNLQVSAHCAPNPHAHVCAAIPNFRHLEYFHDHQRLERMLFDGTLDPVDGALHPDPGRPGHGMALRTSDAEPFRHG